MSRFVRRVTAIAYHRNGVSGEGFYVVRFQPYVASGVEDEMVAVVFDAPGHVAVFDLDKLAHGTIAFGENSWRGDDFEPELRKAIAAREVKE